MRTDWQGNIANTIVSQPFGDGFNQSSSDQSGAAQDNNHFTGQERDSETGSSHFLYRQYSNTQGRWMSPDPYSGSYDFSNLQSLNRYSYVLNNPLGAVDPDGLDMGTTAVTTAWVSLLTTGVQASVPGGVTAMA